MPGMSGLEVLSQIRSKHIFVKVILMTMHREISVYLKSKELGCDAYVLKDFAIDELKYAISEVLQGKNYLSPKLEELLIMDSNKNNSDLLEILSKSEFKIIELVADFKTNKEIASFLFISEKTVEAHKRNIAEKLNLPKGKNILLHWALENFKK
jgi:DNA-binding NarL/FixJ family response regulator